MRIFNHPFRFLRSRGGAATLGAVVVLTAVSAVLLNVGPLRADPEPPVNADLRNAFASKDLKRSLRRYTEKLTEIARAADEDDLLGERVPKSLRKRNIRPFVIDTAVGDGKLVFARTTRSISILEAVLTLGALPVEVVERDIATGTERLIFKSRAAAVGGLMTRAGSTAFGTARFTLGRKSLVYSSSILLSRPGSAGATVVGSDTMRVNLGAFTFCGSLIGAATFSESGALLLSRSTGTCSLANEITSERRLINPDGSERTVTTGAVPAPVNESTLAFENGRLLSRDASSASFGVSEEQSSEFTPLIDGTVSTASMADDGTVAAVVRNSVYASRDRADFPSPLLVFPAGDPDRMVMASRMAGKVRHLKFCAEHLYVVKRVSDFTRYFDWPDLDVSFDWMTRTRARYRVLLFDRNGVLVKSLGDTPKMDLAAVGCEGAALNLAATRGNNATMLRYAP